jgi:hypothetical protein
MRLHRTPTHDYPSPSHSHLVYVPDPSLNKRIHTLSLALSHHLRPHLWSKLLSQHHLPECFARGMRIPPPASGTAATRKGKAARTSMSEKYISTSSAWRR